MMKLFFAFLFSLSLAFAQSTNLTKVGGSGGAFPPGVVLAYAGATVPDGWLECDGSTVSRTAYGNLFAAIGSAHGSGNGTTTFHLPDYRGRFLRGVDGTAGRDPDKASRTAANTGGNAGNLVGSVQGAALGSHNHFSGLGADGGQPTLYGFLHYFDGVPRGRTANNTATTNTYHPYTSSSGGNETRPVNSNVKYIIKF